jgi:hypothetical protein
MASSGVIYGSVSQNSSRLRSAIYWHTTSQDITNNTSTVTVEVLVDNSSPSYDWSGTVSSFTLTINGSTYTSGSFTSDSTNGYTYSAASSPTGRDAERIYSKAVTISHNSDGTKTFSMSTSFSLTSGGYGPGSVSVSGSGALNTIARASQPTLSASSTAIGSAVTVNTNRASTGFTHTITYSFGSASGTIATSVGASVAWTLPTSLANQIPSATSGTGTITCQTYSGSTLIGTKTVGFTATLPSSYVPTITSLTASEAGTATNLSSIGGYVQTISKLLLTINGAAGVSGSTIKSYSITFDGSTYTSSSATTASIKSSGTLTATGTVTDTRGRTATKTLSVTVIPYAAPAITSFTVQRANSDGTLNTTGTYAKVTVSGTYSRLTVSSVDKNTLSATASSRVKGVGSYVSVATATGATGTFSISSTVSTYDALKSYDFQLSAADKFNTTYSYVVLSTGAVTMSWGSSGVGIGKVWESGALDVAGNVRATAALTSINPNNSSADVSLSWLNDIARLRYGGSGAGSAGGFQIQGTGDSMKWAVDNAGNVTVYGQVYATKDLQELWDGASYMNETQTVTPSVPLNQCPTGWLLAWSDYTSGVANNYDYVYTMVARNHGTLWSGYGTHHIVSSNTATNYAYLDSKYLYVSNTSFSGHTTNDEGTNSTIVLRKVFMF